MIRARRSPLSGFGCRWRIRRDWVSQHALGEARSLSDSLFAHLVVSKNPEAMRRAINCPTTNRENGHPHRVSKKSRKDRQYSWH